MNCALKLTTALAFFVAAAPSWASPVSDAMDAYFHQNAPDRAIAILRGAAEAGDISAQLQFGLYLVQGFFRELSPDEGLKWLRTVAENQEPESKKASIVAQLGLAGIYRYGRYVSGPVVVSKDEQEAVRWYRKAAENGNAEAEYELGSYYWDGRDAPQDLTEAVKWYRKAGESGHAHAQYILGVQYADGRIIRRDFHEALYWLQKAASSSGYVDGAAEYLGLLYLKGLGTTQNFGEARRWFEVAAKGFCPYSEYALGEMHENGSGIPADLSAALNYYRAAAQKKFAPAQYRLALAYLRGEGVLADPVEALKWFTLSVSIVVGMNGLELKALFESDPDFFLLRTYELNPAAYLEANAKIGQLRKTLSEDEIEKADALVKAFEPVMRPMPVP